MAINRATKPTKATKGPRVGKFAKPPSLKNLGIRAPQGDPTKLKATRLGRKY